MLFSTGGGESGPTLNTIKKCVAGKKVEVGPAGAIVTRGKDEEAFRAEARQFAQKLKG